MMPICHLPPSLQLSRHFILVNPSLPADPRSSQANPILKEERTEGLKITVLGRGRRDFMPWHRQPLQPPRARPTFVRLFVPLLGSFSALPY